MNRQKSENFSQLVLSFDPEDLGYILFPNVELSPDYIAVETRTQ
jgi:hypothetical protein